MPVQELSDVRALAASVVSREVRARDLIEEILDRDRSAPAGHRCYAHLNEAVLDQAAELDRRADRGEALGPLAGVPVGVKDNVQVAGVRLSAGSATWSEVPAADAEAVARLRAADALIVGMHVMHERALGLDVPHVRNAHDLTRHPGGSTAGGPVSVALGTSAAALGTDTGGSVRFPAAANGVVGLKATSGRISRHGVLPPSGTADHLGVITRTVRDAAALLQVLAGPRAGDHTTADVPVDDYLHGVATNPDRPRIGVPVQWLDDLRADIAENFATAIDRVRDFGGEIVEIGMRPTPEMYRAWGTLNRFETYAQFADELCRNPGQFPPVIRAELAAGHRLTREDADAARTERARWQAELAALYDAKALTALLTPVSPIPALPIEDLVPERDQPSYAQYLAPFNFSGYPAITVPSGLSVEGSPLSVQFVAAPFEEATLLGVARAFESS